LERQVVVDLKVMLDPQDRQVRWVHLDQVVLQGTMALQALQDKLDQLDHRERRDRRETLDLQELQDKLE